MTVLLKRNSSRIAKLALTLLIVASSVFVTSSSADAISVSSSANPAWPNKCGIKIGLLIDRSNSISSGDGATLKTAAKGFVDALAGTSSRIAVAQFRKTATQTLGLTSVFDAAGQTTVKNTIDGYTFGTSDSSGSTNWEAAFYSQQSVSADVVIILTDGNPTQRNIDGSGGNGSSDGSDFNIDAGITRANELKAQGKRVVAVGIGNDVDSTNLAAVSGPTLNDDYFTSSFATLNTKLTQIASTICGGTVTVQKQVKNANGGYDPTNGWDYVATNAVANAKTTAGSGTAEFKYDNAPKTTTITETVKSGFSVESIVCTKNGQPTGSANGAAVTLTVNANDIISCIFKNTEDTGTLKVIKNTVGGNGTFNFTSNSALGNFGLTTVSGTASTAATTVLTGTYDITETVPAGWSLGTPTCTGATPTVANPKVTVTVAKGANVVCTFTNTRQNATLTVVKNTVGGNGTFGFTSNTALGDFSLTTAGGTKSTAATSIPTGSYDVTETALAGWSLTDASCTGTTATKTGSKLSFTAGSNANIVCTFTNTRDSGTLKVVKNATGADGTFNFTSDTALGNFDLTTVGGTASTPISIVPTGTYTLSEVVPANWSLNNLVCTGTNGATVANPKVTLTVSKGDNIVCTFTNIRHTATVKVVKNVTAAGGVSNGTFGFTSNIPGNTSFNLATSGGTASTSNITVLAGIPFEISETVPAGWSLTDITCTGNNSGVLSGSKVTITPAVSQSIVCTYTNKRDTGNVTIVKNATGGNGTFQFNSSLPGGNFSLTTLLGTASTSSISVPTGSYDVSEIVPAGWSLSSKNCADAAFNNNNPVAQPSATGVTVSVVKNSNITCTFTNSRDTGSITIVKKTIGGNGTFDFSTSTPLGNPSITTVGGTGSSSTVAINSGNYSIAESVGKGWTLTDSACTGGDFMGEDTNELAVSVAKGANVVCTFTNTRDTGTVRIVKNTVGGNGTFNFVADAPVGNFSLSTVGNTATTSTVAVNTGAITIAETVPAGWTLSAISCTGGSSDREGNGVLVEINKGANVVCTFTNTRDTAKLLIEKKTVNSDGDTQFSWNSDTQLGNFNLTTAGGSVSTEEFTQATGTYSISENAKSGWTLTNLTCTGASFQVDGSAVNVTLTKGANVVCTFTNTRDTATIKVVKNVVSAGGISDGAFMFGSNIEAFGDGGSFILETENGTASTATVTVPTGFYNVNEGVPADFNLTNQECSGTDANEDGGLYFEAEKGDVIVCTFTNTPKVGEITIVKNVNEAGGVTDGSFDFTSDVPGLETFNLTTENGTASTETLEVPVDNYNIDEIVPEGWNLDSVSCIDLNDEGDDIDEDVRVEIDAASGSANVTEGSDIVCIFTNTRDTLTLQVVENAIGGDDTFDFALTTSAPEEEAPSEGSGTLSSPAALSDLATFSLATVAGTKSTAVITIPTGKYDLTQFMPAGWTLTSISCVGATNPMVANPKVTFTGASGQAIVCTFVNTKTQVQGTVVTRPVDTVVPPQVKGISVGSLPTTGAATQALLAIVVSLLASGGIFFAASRKRKAL